MGTFESFVVSIALAAVLFQFTRCDIVKASQFTLVAVLTRQMK